MAIWFQAYNHKLCRYFKLYNSINAPALWVFELFLAIGEKYYDRPKLWNKSNKIIELNFLISFIGDRVMGAPVDGFWVLLRIFET